jgi:DNA anti-recombination protein RmuC
MSDKDLGESIENFEEEVENLKNTKMKIFGITMTPTTIGALFALITSVLGGLYGSFQVYNDYMGMKEIVENINVDAIKAENEKVILKLDESLLRIEEGTEYTRDIKQGLRDDLLNIEKQVDRMEDKLRESEEETRKVIQNAEERFENRRDSLRNDYDKKANDLRDSSTIRLTDLESKVTKDMKDLESDLTRKLQKALDNPLAN